MSLCKYQEWPFWIVSEQLVFTWTGDKLQVVTYQHCAYSSVLLGEMSICKGRWYIITVIIIASCKLQIPVKECLQYDSQIKMSTTE